MSNFGPERPGIIQKFADQWIACCNFNPTICEEAQIKPTYQEASIWLTDHLEAHHPGWGKETTMEEKIQTERKFPKETHRILRAVQDNLATTNIDIDTWQPFSEDLESLLGKLQFRFRKMGDLVHQLTELHNPDLAALHLMKKVYRSSVMMMDLTEKNLGMKEARKMDETLSQRLNKVKDTKNCPRCGAEIIDDVCGCK